MERLTINGIETQVTLGADTPFASLMDLVKENMVDSGHLISSVRVDGRELGEADELDLADVPLQELSQVDITSTEPLNLAMETLETLSVFTDQLIELCAHAAGGVAGAVRSSTEANEDAEQEKLISLKNLVDGIQTFVDTITTVKSMIPGRAAGINSVRVLEAELLSVLRDLLEAERTGDDAYRSDLLREHLPRNLADWKADGIEALRQAGKT